MKYNDAVKIINKEYPDLRNDDVDVWRAFVALLVKYGSDIDDKYVAEAKSMVGKSYQHKNGLIYTVIAVTNISAQAENRKKHPIDVIYVGGNGNIWSRRLSSWKKSFNLVIKA